MICNLVGDMSLLLPLASKITRHVPILLEAKDWRLRGSLAGDVTPHGLVLWFELDLVSESFFPCGI